MFSIGYPDSVAEDYLDYQKWDTLQALASTISGCLGSFHNLQIVRNEPITFLKFFLATHSVLKGLGVGDEESTALSATIVWILKDGAGHMGRILFAYWKG